MAVEVLGGTIFPPQILLRGGNRSINVAAMRLSITDIVTAVRREEDWVIKGIEPGWWEGVRRG